MISLTANTIGIGLAVSLRDRFTARARAITGEFNRMHGSALKVQQENLRSLRQVGFGMALVGGLGLRGFKRAVNVAAELGFTMKVIQGITSATTGELQQMEQLVISLGKSSIYTAQEVGSALEFLVRSGFNKQQALATLPGMVALGAASGGKAIGGKGGIADMTASILHEFNLQAGASARVADILAKSANISASDVVDLGHALKYSAGQMHHLDIKLEEGAAMLTVLSNAGLKGGIAGRSLNAMVMYLARAVSSFRTSRQMDAFKSIGLDINDVVDSSGKLKPMVEIIKAFQVQVGKMPKVEAVGALATLFQMRGQRSFYPLLEKSLKIGYDFAGALDQLINHSTGYAQKQSDIIMDSMKGDFMILKDTWIAFQVTVGKTLEPILRPVARWLSKILNLVIKISDTPWGKALIIGAAALSLGVTVAGLFLIALTSIKLMTLASTVSFANMGKTLALAWNSGTAAALRYATTAKGAQLASIGGGRFRMRDIATGRFVSGKAITQVNKGFLGMIKNLFRVNGALSWLGRVARVFTGPIGWIVGLFGAVIGFKNMIKLLLYGLSVLLNSFLYAGQVLIGLVKNIANPTAWPTVFKQASERYNVADKNLRKTLGMGNLDRAPIESDYQKPDRKILGIEELKNKILSDTLGKSKTVILNVDGKTLGKIITESDAHQELRELLQTKIKN